MYPVSMEAMRLEGWEDSRLESYQAGKLFKGGDPFLAL